MEGPIIRHLNKIWNADGSPAVARTGMTLSRSRTCQGSSTGWAGWRWLHVDVRLDELCELAQAVLLTEIAAFQGYHVWDVSLLDVQLSADQHGLQGDGHPDLAGKVGVVEAVCVDQPFVGDEVQISPPEGPW